MLPLCPIYFTAFSDCTTLCSICVISMTYISSSRSSNNTHAHSHVQRRFQFAIERALYELNICMQYTSIFINKAWWRVFIFDLISPHHRLPLALNSLQKKNYSLAYPSLLESAAPCSFAALYRHRAAAYHSILQINSSRLILAHSELRRINLENIACAFQCAVANALYTAA